MVEVLGTVTSVLQLISAIKVAWDAFEDFKRAPNTVKKYRRTIDNLEATLLSVQDYYSLLSARQLADAHKTLRLKHVANASEILDTILDDLLLVRDELDTYLDSRMKLIANAKFVFRNAAIVQAFHNIEREKSSLALIIHSIQGHVLDFLFFLVRPATAMLTLE